MKYLTSNSCGLLKAFTLFGFILNAAYHIQNSFSRIMRLMNKKWQKYLWTQFCSAYLDQISIDF